MKRLLLYLFIFCIGAVAIGAGVVAAVIYWASQDLPSYTKVADYRPPQVTTVYARDGSIMGYFYREKRFLVSLEQMSDYLPKAFIAAEDGEFYKHEGIDPTAILRALLSNARSGGTNQGGSTITQQIIKRLLLTPERSYERKVREAILAYRLEKFLTKDEILTIYLNQIYLGGEAHGVEAAAQGYFAKHANELTLAECAIIAGLPQAPSIDNPLKNPENAKKRQRYVLRRMLEDGWITQAEYAAALEQELVYKSMPNPSWQNGAWYLEEVRRDLIAYLSEENVRKHNLPLTLYGEDALYTAGLHVYTAMDPAHQQAAERGLRKNLLETSKRIGWQGPIQHLEPTEYQAFLDKINFNPDKLNNAGWVQALVTEVKKDAAKVKLGNGYTGSVAVNTMAWCRQPNPKLLPTNSIGDANKVLALGDVIWVSAVGAIGTANPVGKPGTAPSTNATAPVQKNAIPAYNSTAITTKTEIPLCLEQDPAIEGAMVSIEVGTGDLVALVGGYEFSHANQFNRATQARRQPGSSFKPIVFSAALDQGYTAGSTIMDVPFVSTGGSWERSWRPGNADRKFLGPILFRTALVRSRNLATVNMAQSIGIENVINRAHDLGIEDHIPPELAVSLGAHVVSPRIMTEAYTAFANHGKRIKGRMITSIRDSWNHTIIDIPTEEKQVISPQNAHIMASILKEVVTSGTGSRARVLDRPVAGKTGTTNEEKDAWFIGFTPYLVTGVYIGYDQLQPIGRHETGGKTALPSFIYYHQEVDASYPADDFIMPEDIVMSTAADQFGSYTLPFLLGTQTNMNPEGSPIYGTEDITKGEELLGQW